MVSHPTYGRCKCIKALQKHCPLVVVDWVDLYQSGCFISDAASFLNVRLKSSTQQVTSGPIGFFDSDFSLEDRRAPQGGVLWAEVRREEGYPEVAFFSPQSLKKRRVSPGGLLPSQRMRQIKEKEKEKEKEKYKRIRE